MPRIHTYLPDDLHKAVREQGLPVSDLLQEAVRAEVQRRRLLSPADEHPKESVAASANPPRRSKRGPKP